MARQRLVTRTIKMAEISVMVVQMESRTVETVSVTLPIEGVKNLDEAVKSQLDDGQIFVKIEDKKINEVLMGMTEEDFIKYARVLPARYTASGEETE